MLLKKTHLVGNLGKISYTILIKSGYIVDEVNFKAKNILKFIEDSIEIIK